MTQQPILSAFRAGHEERTPLVREYIICLNPEKRGNVSGTWNPGKRYTFSEAVEKAKEYASEHPTAELYVCKIVGVASIASAVYSSWNDSLGI
jgi:hypothetical protein